LVYRAEMGAGNPTDVFLPILLVTFISTLAGIIAVSLYQRINLLNRVILLFLGGVSLFISGVIYAFSRMDAATSGTVSSLVGNFILFAIIVTFIVLAFQE
jgi:K+-sensing histidine kinase KdpD